MKQVRSLSELKAELQRRIGNAMNDKELHENLSQKMIEHVWSDVYDVYVPKRYVRRYDNNGMVDTKNIRCEVIQVGDETVLKMGDYAKVNSKHSDDYVAGIIETGVGYDWVNIPPRPFIANTRDDFATNKEHLTYIKEALERNGFTNVKIL